ncbi:hypothetical protein SteCoe_24632 [Stentor coeruleus]|uniref:Protein kinase domain-containing protein n=1 Tax=Stentor coeruleus TaxID=5963 RepID=A0A1R2BH50_9CILI|nr:hypothetical protein SteCoe_24632 [Stentor coeruleus]
MKIRDLKEFLAQSKERLGNLETSDKNDLIALIDNYLESTQEDIKSFYNKMIEMCMKNQNLANLLKNIYYSVVVLHSFQSGMDAQKIIKAFADLKKIDDPNLYLQDYFQKLIHKFYSSVLEIVDIRIFQEYLSNLILTNIRMGMGSGTDVFMVLEICKNQLALILMRNQNTINDYESMLSILEIYKKLKTAEIFSEMTDYLISVETLGFIKRNIKLLNPKRELNVIGTLFSMLNISVNDASNKVEFFIKNCSVESPDLPRALIPLKYQVNFDKILLENPLNEFETPYVKLTLYRIEYNFTTTCRKKIFIKEYCYYNSRRIESKIEYEERIYRKISGFKHFPVFYGVRYENYNNYRRALIALSDCYPIKYENLENIPKKFVFDILDAYAFLEANRIPANPPTFETIQMDENDEVLVYDFSLFASMKNMILESFYYDAFQELSHLIPVSEKFLYYLSIFLSQFSNAPKDYLDDIIDKTTFIEGNTPKEQLNLKYNEENNEHESEDYKKGLENDIENIKKKFERDYDLGIPTLKTFLYEVRKKFSK